MELSVFSQQSHSSSQSVHVWQGSIFTSLTLFYNAC